jgi:hypothetical protein
MEYGGIYNDITTTAKNIQHRNIYENFFVDDEMEDTRRSAEGDVADSIPPSS